MADARSADDVLDVLRRPPESGLLLRGFGPLALALVLLVLMALLVPSIAAERIVERPAGTPTSAPEGADR